MIELIAFWMPIVLIGSTIGCLLWLLAVASKPKKAKRVRRVKKVKSEQQPTVDLVPTQICAGAGTSIFFLWRPLVYGLGLNPSMAIAICIVIFAIAVYCIASTTESNPTNLSRLDDLQQRLIGMVGGDWRTAQRLVQYEMDRNPGKAQAWYWKAAIDTLIRDRY